MANDHSSPVATTPPATTGFDPTDYGHVAPDCEGMNFYDIDPSFKATLRVNTDAKLFDHFQPWLTRLGDAYAFADLKVERVALDELTVSVVTPQTLYEMKRDTIRLKDKADAHALKERFGLKD